MEGQLTGESRAIYISGCGLGWGTYEKLVEEVIQEYVSEVIQEQYV